MNGGGSGGNSVIVSSVLTEIIPQGRTIFMAMGLQKYLSAAPVWKIYEFKLLEPKIL